MSSRVQGLIGSNLSTNYIYKTFYGRGEAFLHVAV